MSQLYIVFAWDRIYSSKLKNELDVYEKTNELNLATNEAVSKVNNLVDNVSAM